MHTRAFSWYFFHMIHSKTYLCFYYRIHCDQSRHIFPIVWELGVVPPLYHWHGCPVLGWVRSLRDSKGPNPQGEHGRSRHGQSRCSQGRHRYRQTKHGGCKGHGQMQLRVLRTRKIRHWSRDRPCRDRPRYKPPLSHLVSNIGGSIVVVGRHIVVHCARRCDTHRPSMHRPLHRTHHAPPNHRHGDDYECHPARGDENNPHERRAWLDSTREHHFVSP